MGPPRRARFRGSDNLKQDGRHADKGLRDGHDESKSVGTSGAVGVPRLSRTSSCEGDDRPGGFNMALASHLVWKLLGVMNTCRNPKAAITHRLYLPVRLNMQSKT